MIHRVSGKDYREALEEQAKAQRDWRMPEHYYTSSGFIMQADGRIGIDMFFLDTAPVRDSKYGNVYE